MTLFDAPVEKPTNIIATIFPWRGWPAQPCYVCHVPLDIAGRDVTHDLDSEGRNIGFRHDGCEPDDS